MNRTTENSQKETKEKPSIRQWVSGILTSVLCVLFCIWTGYYIVLLLVPVFIDIYITKYIRWTAWKNAKNPILRKLLDWVDAILFALVGVYFITTFFFQNYQIPSSSLEKSLLVGDFLCVSKLSYGARSPMTLLSFPLAQHTFPFGGKSYLDSPQLEYQRFVGTGQIERNDIVVFNYPSGDTVATNMQDRDYYVLAKQYGRSVMWQDKATYGDIVYRPVDRRENYVKRCVGLPGERIELRDDVVFIDGKPIASPENVQHLYCVQTDGTQIANTVFEELGITQDDHIFQAGDLSRYTDAATIEKVGLKVHNGNAGLLYSYVFMTNKMVQELKKKPFVLTIIKQNEYRKRGGEKKLPQEEATYPITYERVLDYGDFPTLWIPKRGATILFDTNVDYKVAAYVRCIKNYEHNAFEYRNGKVYINGKEAKSYTFKYNYYFMMGDNRDNSADSRVWGFVPEDHVVGKPMFVWLSLDKDKGWFSGKIRWNRIFTSGNKK